MTGGARPPEARTPENPRGLRDLPFRIPEVTAAEKRRAARILSALRARYPDAHCALDFTTPLELLIATMLSAQATDVGVNKATPALFARYRAASDYASADPEDLHPFIRSIGLYRNKAKAIVSACDRIDREFGGQVPSTMEGLLSLRGVARKTANVVLGNAFGINDGVVVDTHVDRVSKRFGLADAGASPQQVERRLCALFPRESWADLSHLLIWHGRAVCKARGALCATDSICGKFCSNAGARGRVERAVEPGAAV